MNGFLCSVESVRVLVLLWALAISVSSCSEIKLALTCGGGTHPPPSYAIEDLLLDESAFPGGWRAYENTFDPRERLPADRIGLTYIVNGGPHSIIAIHEVYRFSDGSRCAALGYQKNTPLWFAPREGQTLWAVPAELPYQSSVANQFRFGCYVEEAGGRQACQAVGQYEQYLTRFHTFVNPENMSFADLERILIAIDEKMALYLGKDIE